MQDKPNVGEVIYPIMFMNSGITKLHAIAIHESYGKKHAIVFPKMFLSYQLTHMFGEITLTCPEFVKWQAFSDLVVYQQNKTRGLKAFITNPKCIEGNKLKKNEALLVTRVNEKSIEVEVVDFNIKH